MAGNSGSVLRPCRYYKGFLTIFQVDDLRHVGRGLENQNETNETVQEGVSFLAEIALCQL